MAKRVVQGGIDSRLEKAEMARKGAGSEKGRTTAEEWVIRYAAEVGRMLPARGRNDIEMEIRSLILDEAEAESAQGGASEEAVLAVLKRYPRPAEMAQRYGATQYLIGPALYPTYMEVLRLVLVIVTIVMTVGTLLGIFTGTDTESIVGAIFGVVSSLLTAAGIVTLVFAVIERSEGAAEEVADAHGNKAWNPRDLPKVEDRDRATVTDMVTNIITVLVAILWLNLYVTADGSIAIWINEPVRLLLFSEGFLRFIPWLTVLWVAELLVYIFVLARRRWERSSRIVAALLSAGGILVLGTMLSSSPLAAVPFLEPWVRVGVAAALLVTLWELISQLWALYRNATGGSRRQISTTVAL